MAGGLSGDYVSILKLFDAYRNQMNVRRHVGQLPAADEARP